MDELTQDPVMAELVAEYGPLELDPAESEFERLVISIINQSVSTASANAVRERTFALFDEVTPEAVLAADEETLVEAGLGKAKTEYIRNAAEAFIERDLTRAGLADATDQEVIDELAEIHGIGEWTGRMYLIFALGREDVFPVGDLAVRRAMESLYGEMSRAEMREFAERWEPHRSLATLYLWEHYES